MLFSYNKKAKQLSQIICNKPQSSEERLISAAEFTAQFDLSEHLDLPGRQMTTIAYYNIDVVVVGILLLTLLMCIVIYLVRIFIIVLWKLRKDKTE